jgi:uncharacterized protein
MLALAQFGIGLLFGIGLVVAGMSNPAKVLNFLDVAAIPAGTWDASLAFVLGGAVTVAFIGYRLALARERPLLAEAFRMPHRTDIDRSLVTGAGVFGIGWGLAGFCPGPAFTAVSTGVAALAFVTAMLAGMAFARWRAE